MGGLFGQLYHKDVIILANQGPFVEHTLPAALMLGDSTKASTSPIWRN
jgi:hypothetical protein